MAFVDSVEVHTLEMDGTETTESSNLGGSQTLANCVPFMTTKTTIGTSNWQLRQATCQMASGADRVVVARASASGVQTCDATVVEFGSGVSVQSGSFDIANSSFTDAIAITTVDLDKAFVVVYGLGNSFATGRDMCRAYFSSASEVTISRGTNPSGNSVTGYWYVVESDDTAFDVQTWALDLASATSDTATLTAVDDAQTFLICSAETASTSRAPNVNGLRARLTSTTVVTGDRDTSASDAYDVTGFAVELNGTETVQRGTSAWATTDGDQTASITSVDLDVAMAWNPHPHHGTTSDSTDNTQARNCWALTSLDNATTIRQGRGTTDGAGDSAWEVIEWELVAGGAYTLTADAGSYTATGTAAGLQHDRTLAAAAGSVAVTGTAAGLARGYVLTADSGSVAATGSAAALLANRVLAASAGTVAVSGSTAGLRVGRRLACESGSVAATGTAAALVHDSALVAEAGSAAVTGSVAGLQHDRVLVADAGSVAATGMDATLTHASSATLSAESGSFVATGSAATLLHDRVLAAGSGSVTVTGTDATLTHATGYTLNAESGSVAATGSDAGLRHDRVLGAESGAIVATGAAADLQYGRSLPAEPGAVAVTGASATLIRGRVLAAEVGAVAVTGSAATLAHDRVLAAAAGAVVVTGTAATLTVAPVAGAITVVDGVTRYLYPAEVTRSLTPAAVTHRIGVTQ